MQQRRSASAFTSHLSQTYPCELSCGGDCVYLPATLDPRAHLRAGDSHAGHGRCSRTSTRQTPRPQNSPDTGPDGPLKTQAISQRYRRKSSCGEDCVRLADQLKDLLSSILYSQAISQRSPWNSSCASGGDRLCTHHERAPGGVQMLCSVLIVIAHFIVASRAIMQS